MYQTIPNLRDASLYARTGHQQLTREILRHAGIRTVNQMARDW